jgi:transcriptional regulator with XRE-family HTH domain
MSQLAARLRERRHELGLTQQQLAVKADLALVTVARAESGRHPLYVHTVEKLAVALEVPVAALFRVNGDTAAPAPAATERAEVARDL